MQKVTSVTTPTIGFFLCVKFFQNENNKNKKEIIYYNIPMFLKKLPIFEENIFEFSYHIWIVF